MSHKAKTSLLFTLIGIVITLVMLILNGGIEVGSFKTKVSNLEARASLIETRVDTKVDQTQYYQQQKALHDDLVIIKQDIKSILQRVR